jgi:hypothetical protein
MKRFQRASAGWSAGVTGLALLAAAAMAGPVSAASLNKNLTATAQYSSSSDWQSDQGNTTFVAAKAFDGDITTRWNSYAGDGAGAWLAAKWDQPVTVNKVVLREAFDRITGMRVQMFDTSKNDWADIPAGIVEDDKFAALKKLDAASNATVTVRFPTPVTTTGIRQLYTEANSTSLSVFEVEAWNNPAATLTGTVTDTTGNPVAGATVSAGDDQVVTDAAGKYTLTTDVGKYNVTAGKFGSFRNRIARGLDLTADAPTTHDFVLIPTPPNLSLTATAVSSSDYSSGATPQDYDAAKANDGNLGTRWNSDGGDTDGAFLEMQWAAPQTFDKVVIREAIDRIRNYSLQTYDEANAKYVDIPGASNVDVPSPQSSGNPIFTHIFATPITTKRLRLQINSADDLPSIWELEASNAPLGAVTGVVTDAATGKPVPNATLTSDLGSVLGTTDANGAFSVLLDADDYVVTASANGYFSGAPVLFTVNGGDSQQVALTAPAQGPNIALTATASASTEDPSWPASAVNDGDPTTYWEAVDDTNQWVALTWKQPTHFTAVQLQGFINVIESSHLEALAADGKTWAPLDGYDAKTGAFLAGTLFNPEIDANAGNTNPFFFFPDGVTTTGLRYFAAATNNAGTPPGLSEMLVFDSPIPKPAQ